MEGQTSLEGGDIAILGVNTNNNACSGYSGAGEDVITFVAFKDITNNTVIDFTDNGWERVNINAFGDTEGTFGFTRTGGLIPAGTSFEITFRGSLAATQAINAGWTVTDLNLDPPLSFNLNMNSGGDQIFVMQGGTWNNMGSTGEHDATYDGRVLYGFNTRTTWNANGTTQQSNLHPEIDPCFYMNPTNGTTDYVNYTGPTSPTTQVEWINRIKDPNNWTTFSNCTAYNNSPPLSAITITPSGMSIHCTLCSGCGTVDDILTFDLPTTGGPFNVVYTDGSSNFTLNGVNNLHTVNVSVSSNTTFSLVSVTDANGCPVYSNFDGEATITLSGNGGDASITGGGVLCVGNCTLVTFTVSGGTPPYDIDMNVALGPFDVDFTIPVPNSNFSINVCSDDVLLPEWDPGTNTITLPDFIVTNVVITLLSMTDASGCAGTVDPTPLDIDIEDTPSANNAGPLEACDEGGNQATFNLSSLDNTINGNSGNPVDWFTDINTSSPIGSPGSYLSPTATVYATVTQGNCTSDPVAVNLVVNDAPTANPTSDQACDDGSGTATFNLTLLNDIVNGNTGTPVTWYLDAGGNSPIPTPNNFSTPGTTVYATVTAGGCESATVAVVLTVDQAPFANPATDQACDEGGGFATFDLTTLDLLINGNPGNTVSWHSDPACTILIPNPANYATTGGFVYASVSNGICSSSCVTIELTVLASPVANTANASQCDDGSGFALFDLTVLNFTVNNGTANAVSWYEDMNASIPVPNDTSYPSNGGSVWAVVSNGFCEAAPVEVFLSVVAAPSASSASDQACDDGSGAAIFDLTTLNTIVNNGTLNNVIWYFDIGGTSEIPDPANYSSTGGSVYAIVNNGICASPVVDIILSIIPAPTANGTSDEACDDGSGSATFDLTSLDFTVGSGMSVTWYFDITGTSEIPTPDDFNISSNITVYASVFNGLCESEPVAVDLSIISAPTANSASDQACDDGSGTHTFDLTTLDNTVGGGNPVAWFSDIAANTPIPDPQNFDSGSTSVFATVSNGNCVSEVVEITLTLEPQPTASSAADQACDDGSGTYTFDLTTLDNTVGGGNPVAWFSDLTANTPIPDPQNFDSGSTSVFATVSVGNCVSEVVEITLTLEPQPTASSAADQACDDGSGTYTFDLTTLDNTVGGGNPVAWFSDLAANTPIPDPQNFDSGSTSVFATVSNGNCVSEVVEITLTLEPQPTASSAADQACDDGSGTYTFDLTILDNTVGGGNPVAWFSDLAANTPIPDPQNFDSGSTSVFATVAVGNCVSEVVEITLTLEPQPTASSAADQACDDGSGTYTFDLTTLDNTVGGGNPVAWFSDLAANTPIPDPQNFDSGSTSVFATVSNGNCVSEVVEITLTLEPQPTASSAADQACDDGSGTYTFDLTTLDNTIGGGNPVAWFSDLAANTPIPDPQNFDSGSTSVFATVAVGNCVSEVVEITLTLNNIPEANTTSAEACDEGAGTASFNLDALENTVNGGTANIVQWFEDMNATIPISSPYNAATTTIYAIVDNGNCVSEPVAISLIVSDEVTANPASIEACADLNDEGVFDLTTIESIVNGGTANPVNWFEDMAGTVSITPPYTSGNATIYAIVGNGLCASTPVAVDLIVNAIPDASPASTELCDEGNGEASFDLSGLENTVNVNTSNNVTWYEDINATIPVSSPYTTGNTVIYALVDNGSCNSAIVAVSLTINDNPVAIATSADDCDEGNGTATFDLSTLVSTINNNTANAVNFFEDIAGTIPVASPFNTTTTTIYAIVGSGLCVSQAVEVDLNVTNAPVAITTSADDCDEGNGTATFDLSTLVSTINNNTANAVNFFEDIAGTIPVASPFNTNSTTIYAIVGSGLCVSQAVEVDLNVTNAPVAIATSADDCDEGNGTATFDLSMLVSTINNNTANAVNFFEDIAGTIPVASPFNTNSTTIYAIVESGLCVSQAVEVDLNVTNAPVAITTSADDCDEGNGSATFDLSTLVSTINNNTANAVNFFEDIAGTIPVASPFNTNSTTIYAIVGSGLCVSQAVEVDLNVTNAPVAIATSADDCDEGNGTATFDLSTLVSTINNNTANAVNFFQDIAGTIPVASPFNTTTTTIYAIVGSGLCVSQAVEVDLNVTNAPVAVATSADDCDEGNGTATFDLSTLVSTINNNTANAVNFFEDIAGTIPVASPFNSTTTTIYAIVGSGLCVSQAVEVDLNVTNAPVAIATSADDCDEGNGTATFDLSTLVSTINNNTANAVNFFEDIAGTIPVASPFNSTTTTIYAIVGSGLCLSQAVEVDLNVTNAPVAIATSADDCDEGNGTATFDLSMLVSTINNNTANTVNFFEDIAGTIPVASPFNTTTTTIYAIVGSGLCLSQAVEVDLNVTNAPVAITTSADDCDEGNGTATFDLSTLVSTINNNTANAVNFFQDIAGTIPVASPFNTNSTTIYAIVGSGLCLSQAVEVDLNVTNAPVAIATSADDCDEGNGTATFDLSTLVSTINNNTANAVNFFEDIAGTIPVASPFNTNSTTIYAIVGSGLCVSQAVEVDLNVTNAPVAIATSADDCDEGNGTATFDLSTLVSTINNNTANAVNFFEDIAGTIPVASPFNTNSTTIYAIVGAGLCVSQAVEVDLNVTNAPVAITTSADDCDEGNGTATFDLSTLVSTINNNTANAVNFFEDIAGTIPVASPFNTNSTTIYAIVGSGLCVSQAVEVNLNVTNAPVAIATSADDCDEGNGTATFDLSTLVSTINNNTANAVNFFEDIAGTIPIASPFNTNSTTIYAIVENQSGCTSEPVAVNLSVLFPTTSDYIDQLCENESVIINGTTYDINTPEGTEILVGMSSNGCDSIVSVMLDFYDPIIGSISGTSSICNGQSTDLTFNLSGADTYDITYTDGINSPVVLNGVVDGHTISVSPTSTTTYTLLDIAGVNIPCSSTIPTNSVIITVVNINSEIALLSDYQGFGVSCNGMSDGSVEAIPLSGTAPFSYLWGNNETTAILENLSAGNYSVTITDALSCTTESSILLNQPPPINVSFQTISPLCFGDIDGSIIIDTIEGFGSPFEYSLDGEFFSAIPAFPIALPALASGNYELTIQDVNDCAVTESVLIDFPNENQVNLGDDITINLGETIQLNAVVNFDVFSILWNRPDIGCLDCLDPIVSPVETSDYSITVTDTLGCSTTDDVIVYVKRGRNVFIPSAFSPNEDGYNDKFFINADQSVLKISKFRIFDRWGEIVYSIDNIDPNDRSVGWDGDFRGERMNPGVFVYLAEIVFVDGLVELYKGDVTLVK